MDDYIVTINDDLDVIKNYCDYLKEDEIVLDYLKHLKLKIKIRREKINRLNILDEEFTEIEYWVKHKIKEIKRSLANGKLDGEVARREQDIEVAEPKIAKILWIEKEATLKKLFDYLKIGKYVYRYENDFLNMHFDIPNKKRLIIKTESIKFRKIKWRGELAELAYLMVKLKREEMLEFYKSKNIKSTLEHFSFNGEDIKRGSFNTDCSTAGKIIDGETDKNIFMNIYNIISKIKSLN